MSTNAGSVPTCLKTGGPALWTGTAELLHICPWHVKGTHPPWRALEDAQHCWNGGVGSHLGSCSVLILARLCSGPLNVRIVLCAWRLLNIHHWRLQSQDNLINCAGLLSALWRNASNNVPETEQAVQGNLANICPWQSCATDSGTQNA